MRHTILIILIMVLAQSCTRGAAPAVSIDGPVHEGLNSAYYWRTVLHLDSADRAFMSGHDIGRVYLRMFDVSKDAYAVTIENRAVPNASVRISDEDYDLLRDSLGSLEFVPVVYITLDALKAMKDYEGLLASNIVTRVRNMCQYNGLPNVGELQLDCDWTPSTEYSFFKLCDSVRSYIDDLALPWRLSSTIRLHQLSRKVPPVDNGVLMVYNTGSFDDPDADNSIIDIKDVEPYLTHLPSYPLHLDIAYPTYSWQLLFRNRQFAGLLNGVDLADSSRFSRRGPNLYVAKKDVPYNDKIIRSGDMIRNETSDIDDVLKVKALVERQIQGRPHANILYHFDLNNLSKYSTNGIDSIFATGM